MFKFFKKKEPQLFGKNIEPDCSYCSFNTGKEDIVCAFHNGSPCKKYVYDPTKRNPHQEPTVRAYNESDFKI